MALDLLFPNAVLSPEPNLAAGCRTWLRTAEPGAGCRIESWPLIAPGPLSSANVGLSMAGGYHIAFLGIEGGDVRRRGDLSTAMKQRRRCGLRFRSRESEQALATYGKHDEQKILCRKSLSSR